MDERMSWLSREPDRLQESVEETSAWERRSYWVKADRFRAQWTWVPRFRRIWKPRYGKATASGRGIETEIAGVLADLEIKPASVRGRPWVGAWAAWQPG
jgi:hypothetical protein